MSRKLLINCLLLIAIAAVVIIHANGPQGEVLFTGKSKVQTQVPLLQEEAKPQVKDEGRKASASASLRERVSAEAAIVMDVKSKLVLWEKNANEKLYPASTTKIITALTARELYDLDDVITIEAGDLKFGQNLGWQAGDRVKVRDVLRALLIVSANEAGMILADHVPGGYDNFIMQMNQKAKSLGLTQTSFVNPQGFDDSLQQTTAHDLAIAALELWRDEFLREIVGTSATTITTESGRSLSLRNTNHLLTQGGLSYEVKGIKTGTTNLANEALVSLLEKDNQQLIAVVLSAKNRYNDTMAIADFAFDEYVWQQKAKN
ncbi:D-alanyl-D-alanine carboxypeptidase [bacterium]|nr:D-alanyl-D-alanine carboxypeptidase [bacterium]